MMEPGKLYKTAEYSSMSDIVSKNDPYIALICTRCEFFKEDDIELECAAFKALKSMLHKGIITPEEIKNALG